MQTKCYNFYTHFLLLARSINIRSFAIDTYSYIFMLLASGIYIMLVHISVYMYIFYDTWFRSKSIT